MFSNPSANPINDQQPRRSFLQRFLAGLVGLFAGLVPVLMGLVVFLDPLRRRSAGGRWVEVASLDAIPTDGLPRRFPVVAARQDAWNFYPPEPIGSVYLRRTSETDPPVAYSNVCPHLGCSVDYRNSSDRFVCPCHNSSFEADGIRVNPESSPSPRDLDPLVVEVRNGGEVWVEYRRFQGGKSERIEE